MGLEPHGISFHVLLPLTQTLYSLCSLSSGQHQYIYISVVGTQHHGAAPLNLLPSIPNHIHKHTSSQITRPYNDDALHRSSGSHLCCARLLGRCATSAGRGPWSHRKRAAANPFQRLPGAGALPLPLRGRQNLLPFRDRAGLLPARLRAHLRQHN